jgi:hypothetical protein
MKHYFASALAVVGLVATAQPVTWPSLPTAGFVAGRSATKQDVEAGRAVFVAEEGAAVIGKPMPIAIPQYAWFKDGSARLPSIVIQAEEANGQGIVGARLLNGKHIAGLITDFELLGTKAPR